MNSYSLAIDNVFWFVLINLVFSRGLFFLFPAYVNRRFSPVPRLKPYSQISNLSLLLFVVFSIFISATESLFAQFVGILLYLTGLILMITGIFYFAVNEPDRMVKSGIYKYFRHPVYFGNYLQMLGIAIFSLSFELFFFLLMHVWAHYFVMKQEEKDLLAFYADYKEYIQKSKRYFLC